MKHKETSTKRLTRQFFVYELRNALGNGFSLFFGIAFPIILSLLISKGALKDVPEAVLPQATTSVFLGIGMVIPMATMFIGYAANYASELEANVPDRLYLFGFSQKTLFSAKLMANILFLTIGLLLYVIVDYAALPLLAPTTGSLFGTLILFYLFAALLFCLAHGISNLCRKFGTTYGITMTLYFGMMLFSGLMGIDVEALPSGVRLVSNLLPTTYVGNLSFVQFWEGKEYNASLLIQSIIFLGACSALVLIGSFYKRRRRHAV